LIRSWGFRDESGLKGWHWLAILGEESSWNLSRVKRASADDDQAGFYTRHLEVNYVVGLEVLDIQTNDQGEPVLCRYKGTLDTGETSTITAQRVHRLQLGVDDPRVTF